MFFDFLSTFIFILFIKQFTTLSNLNIKFTNSFVCFFKYLTTHICRKNIHILNNNDFNVMIDELFIENNIHVPTKIHEENIKEDNIDDKIKNKETILDEKNNDDDKINVDKKMINKETIIENNEYKEIVDIDINEIIFETIDREVIKVGKKKKRNL